MPLLIFGCTKNWDEHYNTHLESVEKNVWEGMQEDPELSGFVRIIKEFKYDTLFLNTDNTYSILAPDNEALSTFLDTGSMNSWILNFQIAEEYVQAIVTGEAKILTLGGKFVLLKRNGSLTTAEGIDVKYVSPLYRNGRYFKMSSIILPKPNIYEYIVRNNPILKRFMDRQDTTMIDFDKSWPVGYNESGSVIWDTIPKTINLFEEKYFPIKHEFRNKTATLVFPSENIYENALTLMAKDFPGSYIDYNDIPYDWQEKVLIPQLLVKGVFEHSLEPSEFLKKNGKSSVKLKNVLGDSVIINYTPVNKTLCSNGYAYSYSDFVIPKTLYILSTTFEAEWLLKSIGINKYDWADNVTVVSDKIFLPNLISGSASNKLFINVIFPPTIDNHKDTTKYSGKFVLSFESATLLPRKYMMIVRTYYNIGGIYDVYVNDKLVKTIDYDDYQRYKGLYYTISGERIISVDGFNIFDCSLNINEYGKVYVRFVYKGPGKYVPNSGLAIDFIDFIPMEIFNGYDKYRKRIQ